MSRHTRATTVVSHPPGFSACVSQDTMKEIDSLNLNSGPALMAMNGWPFSSKATTSQSPEGVSRSVLTLVILEFGKHRAVELRGFLGVVVEPERRCDWFHRLLSLSCPTGSALDNPGRRYARSLSSASSS